MKTALVLGGNGFIGNHLVSRLKREGYWVRCVDLEYNEFCVSEADHVVIRDLRVYNDVKELIGYAGCERNPYQTWDMKLDVGFDEIYQLAADMGGAGYIFTGENDANIMHNSATINLNVLDALSKRTDKDKTKIFYSSSACMYPEYNQTNPNNPKCSEDSAYPAAPDSEYGWEKLFSERLYMAFARNYGIKVYVARFHNIFGPFGKWRGGKEKAPAAICRKVAEAYKDGSIDVWGDGKQTRSFLYIDDCIDAVRVMMESDFQGPVNIGSEEMVTINRLVEMVSRIAGKKLSINHIPGPQGVRGRNSDNTLIEKKLGWRPKYSLYQGLEKTFDWVEEQVFSERDRKKNV